MKVSEQLEEIIKFFRDCEETYVYMKNDISTEDKRAQDLIHMIEFEEGARERTKLAGKLHDSRKKRRDCKNKYEDVEPIVEFLSEAANKKVISQLNNVLGKIRKVEGYHENRSYRLKVEEGGFITDEKHDR